MNRIDDALSLYQSGYSCAQSIAVVYGAAYGLEREQALRLGTAFAAGMGRRGEMCGAISGALMAIGLLHGRTEISDESPKIEAFRLTNLLMDRFAARHGALRCSDLLGVDISIPEGYAQARQANLFKTLCPGHIRTVAEILEELLPLPLDAPISQA